MIFQNNLRGQIAFGILFAYHFPDELCVHTMNCKE